MFSNRLPCCVLFQYSIQLCSVRSGTLIQPAAFQFALNLNPLNDSDSSLFSTIQPVFVKPARIALSLVKPEIQKTAPAEKFLCGRCFDLLSSRLIWNVFYGCLQLQSLQAAELQQPLPLRRLRRSLRKMRPMSSQSRRRAEHRHRLRGLQSHF